MSDDARRRRGRVQEDARLFGPATLPALRAAVDDLGWLLERGYTIDAALKLVGDRHDLSARQLAGVRRAACTPAQASDRAARQVGLAALGGQELWIDGFNVLVTFESALAHATVIRGRDGAHRDLAGVHGSYHQVVETGVAVDVIARLLAAAGPRAITWYLDRPVSSSGRLRAFLLDAGARRGLPWSVELVQNPDPVLARAEAPTGGDDRPGGASAPASASATGAAPAAARAIVATSDSWILDRCGRWCDLLGELLRGGAIEGAAPGPVLAMRPELWLCDLQPSHEPPPGAAG